MTREESFERLINPLLERIRMHCSENNIPFLAAFDLTEDRTVIPRKSLMCVTCDVPSDADGGLFDALDAVEFEELKEVQ